MAAGPTLYDVLGVSPDASADELRQAYRARARALHPDRNIDAGATARDAAERAMKDLTQAWQVLGDAGRRRRYDRELALAVGSRSPTLDEPRFVTRSDGTMPELLDDEYLDGPARLIRALPWIAIIGVLTVIFIFSAYALTGGPKEPLPGKVGQCITVDQIGGVADSPCNAPAARTVVTLVGPSAQCPYGTERLQPSTGTAVYCLRSR
jgi:DnaJ-domain-containing protein 1